MEWPPTRLLLAGTSALQTGRLCLPARIPVQVDRTLVERVMPPIHDRTPHLRSNLCTAKRRLRLRTAPPRPAAQAYCRRRAFARDRDRGRVPRNALVFQARTSEIYPSLGRRGCRPGCRLTLRKILGADTVHRAPGCPVVAGKHKPGANKSGKAQTMRSA